MTKKTTMASNPVKQLLFITLLISMLIIGWSVQANYHLNTFSNTPLTNDLVNDLVNDLAGTQDEGINPLVAGCDNPFSNSSLIAVKPRAVAFGDFNKDGNLDLVIPNNSASGAVSIRLGDGNGSFMSPALPEISVGFSANSIAVGDINNDGNLDFITGNFSNVSVRLGNGNGGFTAPTPSFDITVDGNPISIALGDINNDGNLDFVTANNNSGPSTVSIRLGNGSGNFAAPATPSVPVGSAPRSVTLGDFNKDGNLDFATANQNSNNVSIRLGNGNGGFTSPATPEVTVSSFPASVAVGDFNKDGNLDFATANINNVSIRLGNGNGTFTSPAPSEITVGAGPKAIAVGDINKDGNLDFVTADSSDISIRLGNGNGSFTAPATPSVPVETLPNSIALGDVNNDGNLDFAFGNSDASTGDVSIRFGNGAADFSIVDNISVTVGSVPQSVAIGDINNDGNLDFAAANSNSNTVSIRLSNGNGGFTSPTTPEVTVGSFPRSVVLGDFNKDGNLDFAATNQNNTVNTISIRLGNGNGGFTSPATPEVTVGSVPQSVVFGDFNNDGNLDFATANSNSNNVSIRLGNGSGGFTNAADVTMVTGPQFVALGDFNKDGNLDFATANQNNSVSIRLGDGTGGFTVPTFPTPSEVTVGPLGSLISSIALGDFNKDGNLDFAATNFIYNNISIRLGNGNSGFTAPVTAEIRTGSRPQSVVLGDFNKDGDLDLVFANGQSNISVVFGSCQNSQKIFQNIAGTPQNAFINSAFGINLKARAINAGAAVSGANVTFTAPASGASGTFIGGSNVFTATTDANGFVTAPVFIANVVTGSYQVIAKITIDGTDRFRSFSLTNIETCPTIILSPGSLPGGTTRIAYSQNLNAIGGTSPYNFAVTSGALPPGLTLSNTGQISGTPTNPGTFNFQLTATDNIGCTGSRSYTILIGGCPMITFSPTTLPDGTVGTDYNQTLTANGGTDPYTFTLATGSLPSGLALSNAGFISGTPSTAGLFNFTVTARDSNNCLSDPMAYSLNIILPQPTITSFTPTSGIVGTSVNITGTNFNGTTAVTFGGINATDFSIQSSTLIIAKVPMGAFSGSIRVTTNAGSVTSTDNFTVSSLPGISINNASVSEGNSGTNNATFTVTLSQSSSLTTTVNFATADGTAIAGSDYVAKNGIVTFNPGETSKTIDITINGDTNIENDESFTVNLSNAVNGTIANATGTGTIQNDDAAPVITSFGPTSVAINGSITINGSGLTNPSAVKLNSTTVPAANIQSVSDSQLIVKVPTGTTSGKITVTTASGTVISTNSFTIVSAPTLTTFVPSTGAAIGNTIMINGSNLNFSPTVLFANNQLATITNATSTQLTVTIPDGAVTGTVQVISAGLTRTSSSVYKIIPRVDDFNPKTITKGTTPEIVITGKSFTGATAVKFGTISVTPNAANVTDTQITVNAPANAVTGTISVVTPSGTGISTASLTVVTPPSVTTISPGSGSVGTTITINGATLTGVTVTFAGNDTPVPATILSGATATSLRVIVPVGAVTGNITVSNAAGSATRLFTVTNGIGSFTPSSGSVGTTVTLTGSGFTGATNVMFGTVSTANFTVVSDNQIDVKVPTVANGNLTIKVVTAVGTFSSATTFTVKNGIGSFSPGSGSIGTQVVITGSGFSTATRVMFGNGSTTTFISKTANQITVAVPNNATTGVIKVIAGTITYTSTDTFTVE